MRNRGRDRTGRALRIVGTLGVAAAVAWHGLRPLSDPDLWWHMRLGALMLESGSLVPTDPFSHTVAGTPWPYKDAGSAILFWSLWRIGGAAALVLFKAALLAGIAAGTWWILARLRRLPPALALLGTALAVEGVAFRLTERAASLSLVLLAATLVVLERHRLGRGRVWWVVPIAVLNANLHRGVVVLPVVVAAYAVAALLQRRLGHAEDEPVCVDPRAPALAALGCALACLATPFGPALVTTTVALMGQHSELITEWAPVSIELVARLTPASFVVLAVVAVGTGLSLWRRRPLPLWDLALVAMALGLGLGSLRHLPYLAVLGVVPAASGLAVRRDAFSGGLAPLIAAATGATALASALAVPLPGPSLGLTPHHFPERATAFVRAADPPLRGNLFNDFGYGGWIVFHLWPEHRVYVDGRTDLVYPAAHVERHVAALRDPQAFAREAQRCAIEWVWLDNAPHARARAHFDADPRWTLVHVSRRGLVYVRRDGVNAALARDRGYTHLWPHDLVGSLFRAHRAGHGEAARVELLRMIDEDPDNPYPIAALEVLRRRAEEQPR